LKANKSKNISFPRRYHFIFWTCYFIFDWVRWGSYYQDYWYSLKSNLVTFSFGMVLFYFNTYILIPKFVLKKKYKRYILFFFITLSVWYVVRTELIFHFVNENVWPESDTPQKAYSFNHIVAVFLIGVYELAFVTAIKLMADWIYERKRVEKLIELQAQTELKFLKSQIQPHFFFNTLNNLYALALEKSDMTASVILKLSDMMQYVLYDIKSGKVRLFTAISYINNYIDLERLRFGDSISSSVSISGEIDAVKVPPLLFLPFIENCFKHGVIGNNDVKIEIEFRNIDNKILEFTVTNTFVQEIKNDSKHGIGNKNVRRRLELLYNTNFELLTNSNESTYSVYLKIPINEN